MRVLKHLRVWLAMFAFGCGSVAWGQTSARSCSQSDVQAAVNAAGAGGIVQVPAGTCSWSGGISLSGVQLIGAGKSASGTVITSGKATLTKHPTYITRLSGFRFTGGDVHATATGAASARAYVIDNNYFNSTGGQFIEINANGGVIHHNEFYMAPSSSGGPDVMALHPGENWSQPVTFGMADTQGPYGGERNIYFEDNTFTNILETAPDGDDGARVVIRYNTYIDSSIVFHGGGANNDSSGAGGGTRQFEVYNNAFRRVNGNNAVNKWIWVRGGSGIIANNYMDVVSTQQFGGKIQIRLGVGCTGGVSWPVPQQIGQTSTSPQNPPPMPLLIFGNTGPGATDSSFISITENGTAGGAYGCSNPSAYVQQNRDYYLTKQWNWVPFTYPHPLASGPSSSLPSPPTSLTVTVN